MKKGIFIFFVFWAMCSIPLVYSNVIIDDPLVNTPGGKGGGVRTVSTTINASSEQDTVTFDVNGYVGVVSVSVNSVEFPNSITESFYINGYGTFTMDFSGFDDGIYTITITLADGQVFSGQMVKE